MWGGGGNGVAMKISEAASAGFSKCVRVSKGLTLPSTQCYSCVMIPEFTPDGNLPPGVHLATWDQICDRFGKTPWRRRLLGGLRTALVSLRNAGCHLVYVDGSFVSSKLDPGDFDACWEEEGVDLDKLDPVLLVFDSGRAA